MIIVLTLGRSGSSLLMQSLEHLGCRAIGEMFDDQHEGAAKERHHDLNPHGYYEEPKIYYGGVGSERFRAALEQQKVSEQRIACKLDVRHLIDPGQQEDWISAAPMITALLVSFREPSEQARSEVLSLFESDDVPETQYFAEATRFLRKYRKGYGGVEATLSDPLQVLQRKTHFIDFASAATPAPYITRIVNACGLSPSPSQFEAAIAHVDPGLMRVKQDELEGQQHIWAKQSGAAATYERLCALSHTGK